jgi:hypothetical protein
MPTPPDADEHADEGADERTDVPLTIRLGTALGAGALAATTSAMPAALRMGGTGWLTLAAIALPFAVVAIGVLRGARMGVRILAGEHRRVLAAGLFFWATLELALLAGFAGLLRKHTHHHGLAGVTFAVFAFGTGVIAALFVRRASARLATATPGVQRASVVGFGLIAFVTLIATGSRAARAEELHVAVCLVDALALAIACVIASSSVVARMRPLALSGIPLVAIVLVLGASSMRTNPSVAQALSTGAPLHEWVLGAFGR